jgi:hypothetical protein
MPKIEIMLAQRIMHELRKCSSIRPKIHFCHLVPFDTHELIEESYSLLHNHGWTDIQFIQQTNQSIQKDQKCFQISAIKDQGENL